MFSDEPFKLIIIYYLLYYVLLPCVVTTLYYYRVHCCRCVHTNHRPDDKTDTHKRYRYRANIIL